MDIALAVAGIVGAAVVGYLLGKKSSADFKPAGADATFFTSNPGSDGFCAGKVLKNRMRGRTFHWARVGSCRPSGGGRFEIRVKSGTSPLIPPVPAGTNDLYAEVDPSVPDGTIIKYSLWQVLADNQERLLHDPELEIASF